MKILHLNTKNDSGGAALVARTLHQSQIQLGHESNFLAGRGLSLPAQNIHRLPISPMRFFANTLSFRATATEAPLNQQIWSRCWNDFVISADIIHLHNAHGYYMPEQILRKVLQKPVVWTLHDSWLLSGRCAFSGHCEGFLNECKNCPHPNYYPRSWTDKTQREFRKRRSLPLDQCQLVAPSQNLRDRFSLAGFTGMKVVPNPIALPTNKLDPSELATIQQRYAIDADKTILLFSAAELESPAKGLDVLQKAFALLPNPEEFQLILAGHSKNRPNFPVKTTFVGPIAERSTMVALYQLSHATLIPSTAESYGMTGPEALYCGCPIICNDLPVFRETMDNQASFIKRNDPKLFAEALTQLSKQKDQSNSASPEQVSYPDDTARAYIALYEKVISNHHSGH